MSITDDDLRRMMAQNPQLSIDVAASAVPQTAPREKPKGTHNNLDKEAATTALLLSQIKMVGLPAPKLQYPFFQDYKADLCWPHLKLVVEIDGGIWKKTKGGHGAGHVHPVTYKRDRKRDRESLLMGWRTVRFVTSDVKDETAVNYLLWWFERFTSEVEL